MIGFQKISRRELREQRKEDREARESERLSILGGMEFCGGHDRMGAWNKKAAAKIEIY